MKNIIQWNYSRGTWQYDVMCLLIIGFIFLTPKSWFGTKDLNATATAVKNVKKSQDESFQKEISAIRLPNFK